MRATIGLSVLMLGLVSLVPAGTASAASRCTQHDRLIQKINAAYHTQFESHWPIAVGAPKQTNC